MNEQVITYEIGDRLYINVTNRCCNNCIFCIRRTEKGVGYNLWLEKEPTAGEIIKSVGDPGKFSEVVFCGYGEPLMRLDVVREVAAELKSRGAVLRVNTNGQASLQLQKNVPAELGGLVDTANISLNADTPEKYVKLCKPALGEKAYPALLDFARECKLYIPRIVFSVVQWPGVDIEKCREIAHSMGVEFRLRNYSD